MHKTAFSAFGATHPVHDPAGRRVRWFCPWPVENRHSAQRLADHLDEFESRDDVSRITVRVVSYGGLSAECMELFAGLGFLSEAVIPLAGDSNPVITYLGKCKSNRQSSEDDIRQERDLIRQVISAPPGEPQRILGQFNQGGNFRIERVGSESLGSDDKLQLIRMHRQVFPTFPYDFGQKLEIMIEAPETYLMVVARSISDGEIYSFSNLELNDFTLENGQQLSFAEFDNSMSKKPGVDRGEAYSMGSRVRLELARLAYQESVDLCHSESRAGLIAINAISHQIGMQFGGALQKHLLISGKSDIDYGKPSQFETMNVWYLNGQHLGMLEEACRSSAKPANCLET